MIRNATIRGRKLLPGLLAVGALLGTYGLATVGVSGMLMATETPAFARGHGGGGHGGGGHGGGHGHGGWHGGGHAAWHGGGRGGYRVGGRYYGGVWYGPYRHWYGGRWWPYGVGSCWAPTPIGWVWTCG
jgi:hypothetical protein